MTYGDLQLKVIGVLQDGANDLPSEEVDRLIQEAVRRYSKVRPREVVEDEVGNGTHDLAVSLLAGWSEGLSTIRQVEYPVAADDVEPPILGDDSWREYVKGASGRVLRLYDETPAASETVRITYTALHLADEQTFTLPESDFDAVANWAASLCCGALARKYSQATSPSLGADSVDHKSKAAEFAARARELKKDVSEHLGLDQDEVAPASVVQDGDLEPGFGGDFLTHPRRWR